jgi:hypothetical protein
MHDVQMAWEKGAAAAAAAAVRVQVGCAICATIWHVAFVHAMEEKMRRVRAVHRQYLQ